MAWRIEFDAGAKKDLAKLDKQVARRIKNFMRDRVGESDNPRSIGEALKGSALGEFWKYRVGDYRVICTIEDDAIRVLVVRIRHRSVVYR